MWGVASSLGFGAKFRVWGSGSNFGFGVWDEISGLGFRASGVGSWASYFGGSNVMFGFGFGFESRWVWV